MKNQGFGKAAILSDADYSKIRRQIIQAKYKLLLDLAWYTGERWGALVQIKLDDVYIDASPKPEITFRARTRKAGPDGRRQTRQVPIHPNLEEILQAYSPETGTEWLFPNPTRNHHISLRCADYVLRAAIDKAGLSNKGISTHSTRRSFINKLYRKGVDIYTIQQITGHRDIKALLGYIDPSIDKIRGAIASL